MPVPLYLSGLEIYCTKRIKTSVLRKRTSDNGIILKLGKPHYHEEDHVEIRVQEIVRSIKRRARELPNAPPSSIFQSQVSTVNDEEIIANMPQRADVLSNINRIQNRHRPINVRSLSELEIVAPYTLTTNGEQFLQFDSGTHDDDRWLMFFVGTDSKNFVPAG